MQLLESLLGSRVKIKILRRLCSAQEWYFGVAELSRDADLNKGVISRVLGQLEKDGAVKTMRKGKVRICRINRENWIIRKMVIPLFENERKMADSILKLLLARLEPDKFDSILSVAAYGSIVKGQFKLTSDVDIMLVMLDKGGIKPVKIRMERIADEFSKRDIVLFCDFLTREEFKKLYSQNEPAIRDIVMFNKNLYGKDLVELT